MIPLQKNAFSFDENICYLNCAYMSPQLKVVSKAGQESVRLKEHPWSIGLETFFSTPEKARTLFASLIDATADDVAMIPSVSYGIETARLNIARQREFKPGANILVLEDQFPSNVYPWRSLVDTQPGLLSLRTVKRPLDYDWTAALEAAIDEQTVIVAVPHCHWTDGSVIDLPRVRQFCDNQGAALVVDASQSLGAMPFSIKTIHPDFLVTASYKWLLGPYSLGFMYIDPKYQQGQPLEQNWTNRKNSENFAELVNYRDDYQPGARRFDVGERSNFALVPMAIAALTQLHEWGVTNIANTLRTLTNAIARRAESLGLGYIPEHARAAHMTGIQIPTEIATNLNEQLQNEKIFVSLRGKSLRISPHLYNSMQDIEHLFHILEKQL